MRFAAAILATLFVASALAGDYPKLDAKNGFRDVKFGTQISLYKGMKLIKNDQSAGIWQRSGDAKQVGDSNVDSISYWTLDDLIFRVELKAREGANCLHLRSVMDAAYGKGRDSVHTTGLWIVTWEGTAVVGVWMWHVEKAECDLAISSIPLAQKWGDRDKSRKVRGL